MATFNLTQDDLTDATTFAEQFLSTKLPQYDFSEGTANRDIAIHSMAYLVAFFRSEIANVKNRQSLLKLADVTDDDSATELVDEILSDWFLDRKTGLKSSGFVQLKFSRQDIGVLTVAEDDVFTRSGLNYKSKAGATTIQGSDLSKNTDNLGVEFYTTTLEVEAEAVGVEYDLSAGPFSDFPQISPYLTGVQSLEQFAGGAAVETSAEMITRSEDAISVRDLVIVPAIKTVLTQAFSQVLQVSPIGMSAAEMQRDLIDVPRGAGTIKIHRGSMIDAYIKFPMAFGQKYSVAFPESGGGLTVDNYDVGGNTIPAVKLPDFPIYKIRGLKDRSVTPNADVAYTVVVDDITLWNSNRQGIYLQVAPTYLNQILDLEYDAVTGYAAVQTYVEDESNRICVADVLAKASFALYLTFEMRYYPSDAGITDELAAKQSLQSYIHGRVQGDGFKVSEIADYFRTTFPGNVVQFPFVVVGELLLPNGKILSMTFTDKIQTPEKYYYDELTPDVLVPLFAGDQEPGDKVVVVLADLQVSDKTSRFVTSTDDITLTSV